MLAECGRATNPARGLILPGAGTGRGLHRNSPPEGFASDKLSPRSEPKPPLFARFCRHEGCSPPQGTETPHTHRLSPSTGGRHDAQPQAPRKHRFLWGKNGAGGAAKFTPAGHRPMAFLGVFFHPRPLGSARNPGGAAQGGVAKGRRCGTPAPLAAQLGEWEISFLSAGSSARWPGGSSCPAATSRPGLSPAGRRGLRRRGGERLWLLLCSDMLFSFR